MYSRCLIDEQLAQLRHMSQLGKRGMNEVSSSGMRPPVAMGAQITRIFLFT